MDCQNRIGQGWLVEGHQKAVALTLWKTHYAGYCKMLTAVSAFGIQQEATGVDMAGIQMMKPRKSEFSEKLLIPSP